MTIEYICINKNSSKENEYFSLIRDAINYAEENDEITTIVKATYEPVYKEETIWERDKDDIIINLMPKIFSLINNDKDYTNARQYMNILGETVCTFIYNSKEYIITIEEVE